MKQLSALIKLFLLIPNIQIAGVGKVDLFELILGESLEELGRLDEAIKSYEECNKIRPNYADSNLTRVNNKLKEKRK